MDEILRLENVSKTFPGVRALDNISLVLNRGEVLCLCGENGAGKSTLIKILPARSRPTRAAASSSTARGDAEPAQRPADGIHTIYQEHIVFDDLDIVENIFAGFEITRWGLQQRQQMRAETERVLRYLKSDLRPEQRMRDLTSGQQKIVDTAKALVFKSNVIILDEPTASFSSREIGNVLDIVRTLRADASASSSSRTISTRFSISAIAPSFCGTGAR